MYVSPYSPPYSPYSCHVRLTRPASAPLANKARNMIASTHVARPDSHAPAVELNPEQQLAVEHGIGDAERSWAAARRRRRGSGKTAMLAHRVAALILAGADPKRIMLATFSRRAAAELRPAGRAAACPAPCARGRRRGDAGLCGTFHAIGARLLREYAAAARPRSAVHHPRPRGFGRPHELGAA